MTGQNSTPAADPLTMIFRRSCKRALSPSGITLHAAESKTTFFSGQSEVISTRLSVREKWPRNRFKQ
jgi:hypothetical protein